MEIRRPPGHETMQYERIAARLGFTFHVAHGALTTHAGYKSETRPATEEEEELWQTVAHAWLVELAAHGTLTATMGEFDVLEYASSPVYLHNDDFAVLCSRPDIEVNVTSPGAVARFRGDGGAMVYRAPAIPKGYFFARGHRIEWLHGAPPPEGEIVRADIVREIELWMKPLRVE